jgi:hypothetical protein
MANPLIPQGTLNRLRGSVNVINFPALNVSAAYLGKGAISVTPEGDVAAYLGTLTGAVTSNEPYQIVNVTIHLLKTQPLAAQYKAQIEKNANIGDIVVNLDSATLPSFPLVNTTISTWDGMTSEGTSADYVIHIKGTYYINSDMWNLN